MSDNIVQLKHRRMPKGRGRGAPLIVTVDEVLRLLEMARDTLAKPRRRKQAQALLGLFPRRDQDRAAEAPTP
jgi:hypothetical protein